MIKHVIEDGKTLIGRAQADANANKKAGYNHRIALSGLSIQVCEYECMLCVCVCVCVCVFVWCVMINFADNLWIVWILSIPPFQDEHAVFVRKKDRVYLTPLPKTQIVVNGMQISKETELQNEDRIALAPNHFYVFIAAASARKATGRVIDYDFVQVELAAAQVGYVHYKRRWICV